MDNIGKLSRNFAKKSANREKVPDFFTIVRYIENNNLSKSKVGKAPNIQSEIVRFSQLPHLKFPENEIANISVINGVPLVTVYFFGLLGPNAPMPLEFTDFVLKRTLSYYDLSLQRFLDIIHNRMLALYYRAWALSNQAVSEDRENQIYTKIISAFSGNSEFIYKNPKNSIPRDTQMAYVHFLSKRTRGRDGLEKILSNFFHIPFKVIPYVNTRHMIPKEFLYQLGSDKKSILGVNIQIGSHYFSNTKKIILEVGEISLDECKKMLPGSVGFKRLRQLVNLYVNKPLRYGIRFIIKKNSDFRGYLTGKNALGINMWLVSKNCKTPESVIVVNAFNWSKKIHNDSYEEFK
ncbi:type VI secretion system baseplate subunit TssG [Helicobacter canadensis]|uniref:Type VI secretion system baseplate subunit TssG n=2 Tax=Helicobacter canadensis TaxID=123841 RepID=C5ZYU4_9HELI|nr:type VI secretion system baseplate subunit TssG [Helicobacter canadensis]EES89202.1 conserved hypothetical protein [Helicobacter canadensis MIT 98-5491]STO99236.1 Uncharacterized protein conserved in bacteria [Helicobacter canadensis]